MQHDQTTLWRLHEDTNDFGRLRLRKGNMIILAEVLWKAKDCVTCFDAYVYCLGLEVLFATEKTPSRGKNASHDLRCSANLLAKFEHRDASG